MPLPLLLIPAVLAVAGGIGAGAKAAIDNSEANDINTEAERIFDAAKDKLSKQKDRTMKTLEKLGELKLRSWDKQMGLFTERFGLLRNVELEGNPDIPLRPNEFDQESLQEMRQISLNAGEVLGGGLASLGAGALAGVAAYGGAMTLATASTGTAIASLSGVAATNATLAWFGGGSLAAGGMGMAGGMAVLGGVVAGPALLVGGIMLSMKAKEKLANARSNRAKARESASQMKQATEALKGINTIASDMYREIRVFGDIFLKNLDELDEVIKNSGTDYSAFSHNEKQTVHRSVLAAQVMKGYLEMPLLKEDGSLHPQISNRLKQIATERQKLDETQRMGSA